MNFIKLAHRAIAGWIPFGQKHCVLCSNNVWDFLPYNGGSSALPIIMQELEVIGSDVDNFSCPRCRAHDRERHLFLYMQAAGTLAAIEGKKVLHFAPERQLSKVIQSCRPNTYIACDLHPTSSDIISIDMLDMDIDSGSVDLVIANHVLEHVDDFNIALSEIHRILREDGLAILQTPYSPKLLKTWEDQGISSPTARHHIFGQSDHIRLFGRDIFQRIVSSGFESCVSGHSQLLPKVNPHKFGINPREPFFLFKRR